MGGNELPTAGQRAILARDTGLALLRVTGKDATEFLNAQTTAALDEEAGTAQFSALADPRGRVLIVFYAWYAGDGWTLALASGEVEWLTAHLSRFVFRAQVRLVPRPDLGLLGLAGARAIPTLAAAGCSVPPAGHIVFTSPLRLVGLTDERWLAAGEKQALAGILRAIEPNVEPSDESVWKRGRFAAGEIEIRAETRGRFLPQMLGLIERGAVSSHKGCYPGQEVITRLEHRGQVKRKVALFEMDATPKAGAKIGLGGTQIEVLDSVALDEGGALVQAVAPFPLPSAISAHLKTSDANA